MKVRWKHKCTRVQCAAVLCNSFFRASVIWLGSLPHVATKQLQSLCTDKKKIIHTKECRSCTSWGEVHCKQCCCDAWTFYIKPPGSETILSAFFYTDENTKHVINKINCSLSHLWNDCGISPIQRLVGVKHSQGCDMKQTAESTEVTRLYSVYSPVLRQTEKRAELCPWRHHAAPGCRKLITGFIKTWIDSLRPPCPSCFGRVHRRWLEHRERGGERERALASGRCPIHPTEDTLLHLNGLLAYTGLGC